MLQTSENAPSLASRVISLAASHGLHIATAESLTGGLVADALVSVPGASRVFRGGIVAYDTALKHTLLGVDAQLLAERGPVDGNVAKQMARGVRLACAVPKAEAGGLIAAELGVSTTGVAGPDPDAQSGQPAGVVWVGTSAGGAAAAGGPEFMQDHATLLSLTGNRTQIRAAAVDAALEAVLELLQSRP